MPTIPLTEKNKAIMKKPFSYLILLAVIALLGYKSVYFRKLSEVQASAKEKKNRRGQLCKKNMERKNACKDG